MDLEKWIPVIVSVIGVFAGSIPFILAAVSNESTDPPTIDLVKQVSDIPIIDWFVKSNHALFTFSNIGQSPATNVSLVIDSPKKIINVTKISGISKLILQNPNSSLLENNIPVSMNRNSIQIDIPKLINGKASLTEIKVSIDGEQGVNDYQAFIIFDQGSDIGRLSGFLLLESPAHLILYGILYFFYIFFIIRVLKYFFRLKGSKDFAKTIRDDILSIRRELISNPSSNKRFNNTWGSGRSYPSLYGKGPDFFEKEPNDFILLEDLYMKIDERNKKIAEGLTGDEMQKVSSELLNLIQEVLKKVDWNKYV